MFKSVIARESFVGFTIDGIHSSSLGIIRTFGAKNQSFVNFSDVSAEKNGADGEIWWSTTYSKKDIPIEFAYCDITELQLSKLKKIFNSKKLMPLVLDEDPYKIWMVKASQSATTSQISFEKEGKRLYSGTGSVVFTSPSPYARCDFLYHEETAENDITGVGVTFIDMNAEAERFYPTYIDNESEFSIQYKAVLKNAKEWRNSLQLPRQSEQFSYVGRKLTIWNSGVVDVGFKLYFLGSQCNKGITITGDNINIKLEALYNADRLICVDFYQGLVYDCDFYYNRIPGTNRNRELSEDVFGLLSIGKNELACSVQPYKVELYYLFT